MLPPQRFSTAAGPADLFARAPGAAPAASVDLPAKQKQQHPVHHLPQHDAAEAVDGLNPLQPEAVLHGLEDMPFQQLLQNIAMAPAAHDDNFQQYLGFAMSPQGSGIYPRRQLQQLVQTAGSLHTEDLQAMDCTSDVSFEDAAQQIDRLMPDSEDLEWVSGQPEALLEAELQWQQFMQGGRSPDITALPGWASPTQSHSPTQSTGNGQRLIPSLAAVAAAAVAAAAAAASQPMAQGAAATAAAAAASGSFSNHRASSQAAPQISPRQPPSTDTSTGPAAKRLKASHCSAPATAAAGGSGDVDRALANEVGDNPFQQQEADEAARAGGSKDLQPVLQVTEQAAGHQEEQQHQGRLPTAALSRSEAAAALSRLDAVLPDSVYAMADDRAYLGLQVPLAKLAQGVVLTGPDFAARNGPILCAAFSELMGMKPTSSTASEPLCELFFDPDDMCNPEGFKMRLLDDVPERQLRTVKGLKAAVSKVAVAKDDETDEELKVGIVQVAVDVKREGLGLRAFFWRALPLLQRSAAAAITAPTGSHAIAADVVRTHMFSLAHVARILVTVHNMLLASS